MAAGAGGGGELATDGYKGTSLNFAYCRGHTAIRLCQTV